MKKTLIISILLLMSFGVFAGGGWTAKKGGGYFKIGQNAIIADQFFTLEGDIVDITTISLYTTSAYIEYGITDKLTGIAYVPFFVRSTLNEVERRQSGNIEPGDEVNSFGDTDLGLKYGLISNEDIALSASLILGLPFGQTAGGTTESGEARILQTGDGEFNQMVMIDASHSFYPKPVYVSAGVGFNNRTENFSDEFRYTFELGWGPAEGLNIALKVNGVRSLKNGDPGGGAGSGIFGNNIQYLAYGPEISYLLGKKLGVSGSAAFASFGENVLASPNLALGVFMQL